MGYNKFKLVLIILFVSIFTLILYSCSFKRINSPEPVGYYGIRKIKIEGHYYLKTTRGGITHMESCPCKN